MSNHFMEILDSFGRTTSFRSRSEFGLLPNSTGRAVVENRPEVETKLPPSQSFYWRESSAFQAFDYRPTDWESSRRLRHPSPLQKQGDQGVRIGNIIAYHLPSNNIRSYYGIQGDCGRIKKRLPLSKTLNVIAQASQKTGR